MSIVIHSILIAIISIITFSCSPVFSHNDSQEIPMEVPSRLELKVGESYTLKLKGRAAAGYIWSYTVEKNDNQVTVSQSAPTNSATANGEDNTHSSYSLDEVFIIRAIAPGQTKIYFVQRRPWEKDQPPLHEQTVDIVVR